MAVLNRFRPLEILIASEQRRIACIWLNSDKFAKPENAYWKGIWNSAAYRLATDGAGNLVLKRRGELEKPHFICGDFDSLEDLEEKKKMGFELIHLPDQDKTDLQKTIEFCYENRRNDKNWEFDVIVLLGGLNGRFDHTMSTLSTLAKFAKGEDLTPIYVMDGQNLVMAVGEGESEIEVELEKTTKKCGVIPIVQKETVVTSRGLKWDLDNLKLEFGGMISSSNELVESKVYLRTNQPLIFTIELERL